MDTGGAKESVHINGLSMLLGGLKLGKMYDKFLSHARQNKLSIIMRFLMSRVMGQVSSNICIHFQ